MKPLPTRTLRRRPQPFGTLSEVSSLRLHEADNVTITAGGRCVKRSSGDAQSGPAAVGPRRLFRRSITDPAVHPHEALVGALALLHAASSVELRHLRVDDFDQAPHTLRLGHRPLPVPLDPVTMAMLRRCLDQRASFGTRNPHVIVTTQTKTRSTPASPAYLCHVLDAAGVPPKLLRSTRIVDLVVSLDPKVVSAALGMKAEGLVDYLADHVDAGRLPAQERPNL